MTVAALDPEVSYLGNGATTAFAAPFRFLTATLSVELLDGAGGTVEQALGTDYTATGGETDAGGTVTMVVAPAVGETLRIRRSTPRAQQTAYETNDPFPAQSHERALDQAMLINQEQDVAHADLDTRAIKMAAGGEGAELPLDATGVLTMSDGTVIVSPLTEVLQDIGVTLYDDGAWGGSFEDDGAWG